VTDAINTIVFVNNAISARLAHSELRRRGVACENVALFLLRRVRAEWFDDCAMIVDYGHRPSHKPHGQLRFAGFYWRAARILRHLLEREPIRRVYVVNSDNLLTNHVLAWSNARDGVEVSVLVEGIMNFQDIRLRNRAWWRTRPKATAAALLGLEWEAPSGHLSGAEHPSVSRVITFARTGLQASSDKVELQPFEPVQPLHSVQRDTALVVYTGLWQWMPEPEAEVFFRSFVQWLEGRGFARILVKPHPHVSAGVLESMMPEHEVLDTSLCLEELAPHIEAGTVVGTCCTGLITLRLLRPDLRCVDFGSEAYCKTAYFGDRTVISTMREVGVELVQVDETTDDIPLRVAVAG